MPKVPPKKELCSLKIRLHIFHRRLFNGFKRRNVAVIAIVAHILVNEQDRNDYGDIQCSGFPYGAIS